MGYTVIAPVGDNLKALFVGIKEFPTERVILISPTKYQEDAKKLQRKLNEFTIKSKIIEIDDINIMEEMFRIFGNLASLYNNDDLLVNVATGDRLSTCATLSAAYANGLRAFAIMKDKVMHLPIMKLSYYNELSKNKLEILKKIDANDYISLKELSKKLGMSISLLSYHINGNRKYKGLKEFRLVEVKEKNKNVLIKLSEMGNLLLKGYIKPKDSNEAS